MRWTATECVRPRSAARARVRLLIAQLSQVLLLQRLASWLEHAHVTADIARVAAYIILGVFRTPFAMTWPCAITAGAALCKRFHSIAWEILWGAVETETLELISTHEANPSAPLPALASSSSDAAASFGPGQAALDIEFPAQEAEEGDGIELDLNIDNDSRKKSAKGDKGRVIMFDVIESILQRVTVKDLVQQTAAVQREYLSGGVSKKSFFNFSANTRSPRALENIAIGVTNPQAP